MWKWRSLGKQFSWTHQVSAREIACPIWKWKPEEEDGGEKISFAQVAQYQVNGNSDEEESDDEHAKFKTLNSDYLYLDIC